MTHHTIWLKLIKPLYLKKRAEFLLAAKGRRYSCALFKLLFWQHRDALAQPQIRFGLTVTKKTGNAVERNRMKRRLRAALERASHMPSTPFITTPSHARCDYVIIANRAVLHVPFQTLVETLIAAAIHVQKAPSAKSTPRPQNSALLNS